MPCKTEPLLADLIGLYLKTLATRSCGALHISGTRRQLERIASFCGGDVPTPAQIIDYRASRLAGCPPGCGHPKIRQRGCLPASNRTVGMEEAAMSAMLTWAVDEARMLDENPIDGMKPLPQTEANKRRKPHPMSDDEMRAFLRASRELDKGRKVPQTPLWKTLLLVGLRWGDVCAMRPENIRGDSLLIAAESSKGKRMREIPLPPGLAKEIHLPFLEPNGRPWTKKNRSNARRILRATMKRAGLPICDSIGRSTYLHSLRASAATRMFRRGARIPAIAQILGHADPSLTMRLYVKPSLPELTEDMRNVWADTIEP